MVMLKICKHTFYANLSQIWKFTRFIRKVFATKILLSGKFSIFLTLSDVLRASNIGQSPCIHIPYSVVIGTYQSKRLLAMSLVYMSSCVWSEGQRVPQSNQYPTVSLSKYHSVPRLSPTNTQPSCQGLNYLLCFRFLILLTISFFSVVCSCYQWSVSGAALSK